MSIAFKARALLCGVLFASLVACSSTVRIYDGPPRPAEQIALLWPSAEFEQGALFSNSVSGLGFEVRSAAFSTKPRVYLVAVDGRSVAGAGNEPLEVEAGKHNLKCRLVAAGGTNEIVDIDIDVKGGYSYSVRVFLRDGSYWLAVEPRATWSRRP